VGKDGGPPLEELDETARQKAETRFFSFYELNTETDAEAQGPAGFH